MGPRHSTHTQHNTPRSAPPRLSRAVPNLPFSRHRPRPAMDAARKPLNPLAMEIVPAGAAPRRALNPFATEFVPARALLNPLAMEFVPAGAAAPALLDPFAMQFVQPAGALLNPLAGEFVPGVGGNIVPTLNPFASEFVPWWRLGGGWSSAPNVVAPPEFYFQPGPVVVGYPVGGTTTGRPSRVRIIRSIELLP